MRSLRASAVFTTWLVTSCSLVFDTHDARRRGPTAPTIHVSPSPADTGDALSVVIDTPSPARGDASITYAYAWRRDGELVSTEERVPAALTTKGERWEVTVTPMADGIPGIVATAGVTIENAPPSVRYVDLSSHDPFDDDTVELLLGPASDEDGDRIDYDVEWLVDGVVVAGGETQRVLATTPSVAPGSTLEVRVTPSDGTSRGATVSAGPVRIRPAGSQWRPLVPHRGASWLATCTTATYDPIRRRVLFVEKTTTRHEIWAYPIDERRFIRLVPENADTDGQFLTFSAPIFHPGRQQLVFAHVYDPDWSGGNTRPRDELKVLDVSTPGREVWRTVALAPDATTPALMRAGESAFLDVARDRIVVYGGGCGTGDARSCDDLWAIHLAPGAERWERLLEHAGIGAPLGGAFVADTRTDRAYLVGGTRPASHSESPPTVATRDVRVLDLTTDTFSSAVVAQAPANVSHAGAVAVPGTSEAFVVHGVDAYGSSTPQTATWRFDMDALTFTPVTTTGDDDAFLPSKWPYVGYDPDADRIVVARGGAYGDAETWRTGELAVLTVERASGAVTALDVPGVTSPRGVRDAVAVTDLRGGMMLAHGRGGTDTGLRVEHGVFTIDREGAMRPQTSTTSASRRYRAAYGPGATFDRESLLVFGGLDDGGAPITDVWRMSAVDTPTWTLLGTFSGADATGGRAFEQFTGRGVLIGAASHPGVSTFVCTSGHCTLTPCTSSEDLSDAPAVALPVGGSDLVVFRGGAPGAYRIGACEGGEATPIGALSLPYVVGGRAFALDAALGSTRAIIAGPDFSLSGDPRWAAIVDVGDTPSVAYVEPVDGMTPSLTGAAFVWDPERRRLLAYGGSDGNGTPVNGTSFMSHAWVLRYVAP